MEDYRKALNRLYALGPGSMLPGRDRLRNLLAQAGNQHLAMPTVLIGGTNGKGSVVAGLSAALSAQMPTGAFIKPHLKSIRERWRINDQPVAIHILVSAINRACDLIEEAKLPISFFEANVLVGALCFAEAGCDIVVWEVGLGGSEDACNLVDPEISVITNVGYDHQAILGESLAEIASDKSGIARTGKPLLLGPPRVGWEDAYEQYREVVIKRVGEIGAQLIEVSCKPETTQSTDPFAVQIQADTYALIYATITELQNVGIVKPDVDIDKSLEGFHYRGRLELTHFGDRPVILDAAHNVDSLRFLAGAVQRRFNCKVPVVFGCQVTHNPLEMLTEIRDIAEVVTPIEIPVLKPCPIESIIAAARKLGIPVSDPALFPARVETSKYSIGHVTELDPPDNSTGWIERVEHGLALGTPDSPCLICGSIYNLGEILRVFET